MARRGSKAGAAVRAFEAADRLHAAAIHLLRRLRVRDLASGVGPAQLSALSVLVFGGPRSLGELAQAEQVKPPTMSRIVAGLERSGLVRRKSTEDRRKVILAATGKGTRILQQGRRRRVESLARALRKLDQRELAGLAEMAGVLERVIRTLR
jgi:DNA-binding MarR family transcriptional regulator